MGRRRVELPTADEMDHLDAVPLRQRGRIIGLPDDLAIALDCHPAGITEPKA